MKIRFSALISITAALLAGCAAYYSIFGLSKLFAGAGIAVIIMASSLEISKIVAVTILQRYWNILSRLLKIYLSIGIFVLVCITSAGIYGFLSSAYQDTSSKYILSESKIALLNNKKELFENALLQNKSIINNKTTRINQLNTLRASQEARLDKEITNANKNRVRSDINQSNIEIQKLTTDIDQLNIKNNELNDSISFYSSKVIETNINSDISGEIGPLKYIAELSGLSMDKVVNRFIILLIIVFDPLAMAFVIAANRIIMYSKENTNSVIPTTDNTRVNIENEQIKNDRIEDFNIEINNNKPDIEENVNIKEIVSENINDDINSKKSPVIPTGTVKLEDIKEKKESNRGFSAPIPSSNMIQRIGSNKYTKDGKVYFRK